MTAVEIIRGVFNPECAFTGKETKEIENSFPPVRVEDSSIEGLAGLFEELPPNPSRDDIAAWLRILLELVRSSATWAFPHSVTLVRDHGALQVLNPGTVRVFNLFFMRLRQLLLRSLFRHDDVVVVLRNPAPGADTIPVFSPDDKQALRKKLQDAVDRQAARVAAEAARAEAASVAAASALADMACSESVPLPDMAPFEMDPLLLDAFRWVPPPPVPPGSPQLPPQVTAVLPGSPPVPPLVIRSKKKACRVALGDPRRVKKRACPQALPIDGASAIPAKRQKAIAHVREVEPVAAPVAASGVSCGALIQRALGATRDNYTHDYHTEVKIIITQILAREERILEISNAYKAAAPIAGRRVDTAKGLAFVYVLFKVIQDICGELLLQKREVIIPIAVKALLRHGGINEKLGYKPDNTYWWNSIL